jgi:tRNA (guanosine-2'-O-)-methyltransferase
MPTKARIKKVEKLLSLRQPDLRVVLEEVTNTHNASAVVRTCDAAGVLHIDVISAEPEPFPVNEAISTRADKWLNFSLYSSVNKCFRKLKAKGFKIAATHLKKDAVSFTSLDYTQPIAIVLGNEFQGISEEACSQADYIIKIPMFGMAQSLNLSVSAGIILYEAVKQRMEKGYYGKMRLSPEDFAFFRNRFLTPDIKKEGGI